MNATRPSPEEPLTETMPEEAAAPRIIPRSEHPISRKNIDREALKVLYRLRDAGHTAFLVGGGVRDLYLGKKPKDFDISTDARPGQLRKLFRNSRLIGRRFRLVQIFFHGNKIIEVSTFRCRSEHDVTNSGKEEILAANNTFGTPADDSLRRDLTINALFYDIENLSIIDYIGGVTDLNNGVIRTVGDPNRRLSRDPVRIMRVIRHAARNDFVVEKETWAAIGHHLDKLTLCPVSRLRDELFRDLHSSSVTPWIKLAMECGLIFVLLPFYKPCLLDSPTAKNSQKLLLALARVIDRIHEQQERPLADHLLLAALLIPWAEAEFDLMNTSVKGPGSHGFSRSVRNRLDADLENLSISRALREGITQLLVHLPLFSAHGENGAEWPKWLKRKSYFKECSFLYQMLMEATGKDHAPTELPPDLIALPSPPRAGSHKRSPGRGKRGPALAPSKKGGIFGLKK